MPGCVLHASGEHFAVDAFMAESSLAPYKICHRGDSMGRASFPDRCYEKSSLSLDASSADGDLAAECADVLQFLRTHASELSRLAQFPGVTDIRLDFAYYRRRTFLQCDYLPPELLFLAGSLRIGIELSLYPAPIKPRKKSTAKSRNG
jgi:hypothetical protein